MEEVSELTLCNQDHSKPETTKKHGGNLSSKIKNSLCLQINDTPNQSSVTNLFINDHMRYFMLVVLLL
jgi:hypothetical protein